MTPFAQLGLPQPMEKAAKGAVIKSVVGALRNGLWGTLKNKSADKLVANPSSKLWKGTGAVSNVMGSTPMRAAGAYGMGAQVAQSFGLDLPGGDLAQAAMYTTMPGWSAAFAAPEVITGARMSRKHNQDALKGSMREGADGAVMHFMSAMEQRPEIGYQRGSYKNYMQDLGLYSNRTDGYLGSKGRGPTAALSGWAKWRNALAPGGAQRAINGTVDREVENYFRTGGSGIFDPNRLPPVNPDSFNVLPNGEGRVKYAHVKSAWLPAVLAGARAIAPHLLRWGGRAATAAGVGSAGYGIYDASTRKNPYSVEDAQDQGYAAAQAKIQQTIGAMSPWQRAAARWDPSLITRQLDKKLPGTISAWENATGKKYQPGFLSGTMDAWSEGGKPSYYSYGADGARNYLPKEAAAAPAPNEIKNDKHIQARRRLHLKAAITALKLGALGAVTGGVLAATNNDVDMSPAAAAGIGGAGGATLGYGFGYGTGKLKQLFGYDPLLDTVAVTGST